MIEFLVIDEPIYISGNGKEHTKKVLYKEGDWPLAMTEGDAIELAIQKWEWIAQWYRDTIMKDKLVLGGGELKIINYDDTCALCDLYHHSLLTGIVCMKCPVLAKTGLQTCKGTPWVEHHEAKDIFECLTAAKAEIEFLKGLAHE